MVGLPFSVAPDEAFVDVGLVILQIGALQRIVDHVKEKRVVVDLQILHVAVAHRLLRIQAVAPVDSARHRCRVLR